jgi:hypothetical protein
VSRFSPIRTRSGKILATNLAAIVPSAPAERGRSQKRRRDKGDKAAATSADRSASRRRKRRRDKDDIAMAGPIPLLQDTHHQRNVAERFEETVVPPPMDVDGLSRIAEHPALVSHLYFLYSLFTLFLFRRNAAVANAANSVVSRVTRRNSASNARRA